MTHIENSDRGITLSKPLAWTILVAVVSGAVAAGNMLGTQSAQLRSLSASMDAMAVDRDELRSRVSALERDSSRDDARFDAILQGLARIDMRLDRLERERHE